MFLLPLLMIAYLRTDKMYSVEYIPGILSWLYIFLLLRQTAEMPKTDYTLQGGFGLRGDGLHLKLEE